jgi:hypothetical protein
MKTFATLALSFVAAALLSTQANAREQQRVSVSDASYSVAMFRVDNRTSIPINYAVKWGGGEWKNYTLMSGGYLTHYYPLSENNNTAFYPGCGPGV